MTEKKFPHGAAPRQEDAALEDNAVEAVTGGKKTSKGFADGAWDWAKGHFGGNDDEEEP